VKIAMGKLAKKSGLSKYSLAWPSKNYLRSKAHRQIMWHQEISQISSKANALLR
jgi:hypothetical protein